MVRGPVTNIGWKFEFGMLSRDQPSEESPGAQVIKEVGKVIMVFLRNVLCVRFDNKTSGANRVEDGNLSTASVFQDFVDRETRSRIVNVTRESIAGGASPTNDQQVTSHRSNETRKHRLADVELSLDALRIAQADSCQKSPECFLQTGKISSCTTHEARIDSMRSYVKVNQGINENIWYF